MSTLTERYVHEVVRRIPADQRDVLDPALWSGWIWPILAGLAGLAVLDVVRATRP